MLTSIGTHHFTMPKENSIGFITLSLIFLASIVIPLLCDASEDANDKKTYIIYMGSLPKVSSSSYSPTSHHLSILQQVINGSDNKVDAKSSLVRSYKRSFNGFAAKLTSDQRDKIAQMEGVVSVFESKTLQTMTTRSWDFMGFPENIITGKAATTNQNTSAESEVIVGMIDTGIWPESESFSDENFGPIPKKWRGTCAGGKNFTCNKKIIGARYYIPRLESARDISGHGTHTASTAAGNIVYNASFYGIAQGSARGGAPLARIAVYVACAGRCGDMELLAAFDDAISDGVTIISVSIGYSVARGFLDDSIAIGSFHAMERGILTVQSAGNTGQPKTVSSVAPWVLTVAASSIDRKIIDKLVLGNGHTIIGNSVNSFPSNGSKFPLTMPHGNSKDPFAPSARVCDNLDANFVKGKILLCLGKPFEDVVQSQGVAGIIVDKGSVFPQDDLSNVVSLPSLDVSANDYGIVLSYINSTQDPKAEILRSESIEDPTAPIVVSFSSRGPNAIVPEIIKPDISAPGVNILAAWSPIASPSVSMADIRHVNYNIISGTSMACPHASGIAAYLKSLHPDWSPAAIKSAILTTTKPMNKSSPDSNLVGEFEYGSGHLNPIQASDPGLVYDISKEDYVEMLCNFGFNVSNIKKISGENSTCPLPSRRDLVKNLNYPSLGATILPSKPFIVKFNRTVTNVGFANSTYKASVLPSSKVNITVEPEILVFKSLNEKKSFVVTVEGVASNETVISSLVWSDSTHNVRSPIIVMPLDQ